MDTTTIVVVALVALIIVAIVIAFRQNISVIIRGLLGMEIEVSGANPAPATRPGVSVKGAISREGGLLADDKTGRGVDLDTIDTKDDIIASSESPNSTSPKA